MLIYAIVLILIMLISNNDSLKHWARQLKEGKQKDKEESHVGE